MDNLQPDFLYDHIQPVRAELMQALWKTLRNPSDSIAQNAFRVLGKFGGGNRKMLREPQKVRIVYNLVVFFFFFFLGGGGLFKNYILKTRQFESYIPLR